MGSAQLATGEVSLPPLAASFVQRLESTGEVGGWGIDRGRGGGKRERVTSHQVDQSFCCLKPLNELNVIFSASRRRRKSITCNVQHAEQALHQAVVLHNHDCCRPGFLACAERWCHGGGLSVMHPNPRHRSLCLGFLGSPLLALDMGLQHCLVSPTEGKIFKRRSCFPRADCRGRKIAVQTGGSIHA